MSGNQPVGGIEPVDSWVEQTRLVREWRSLKEEIALHKWYASEKAGYDIGWDRATTDYLLRVARKHCDGIKE